VSSADKDEHDKAIADYTEAIRLDPKNALAYYHRGVAYGNKGEHDKAIADCTEAIRLTPDYSIGSAIMKGFAYRMRTSAYVSKAQYDKAFADYCEAVRDEHIFWIVCDMGCRNAEKAIADSDEAIDRDPKNGFVNRIHG
jgi:tetratricopeptide (TPR) repeat protein